MDQSKSRQTGGEYSALPRQRRGHRRVSSAGVSGEVPGSLAGQSRQSWQDAAERQDWERWLKEQRPPHHEQI